MTDLKQREQDIKNRYKVVEGLKKIYDDDFEVTVTMKVYKVIEVKKYYSDSLNPAGEWGEYEATLKTYKTIKGAIKGLLKEIIHQFPKGYFDDKSKMIKFVGGMVEV